MRYDEIIVTEKLGVGHYKYNFISNTSIGIKRYELYADSIESAMEIVENKWGSISDYMFTSENVLSIQLRNYPLGSFILYWQ